MEHKSRSFIFTYFELSHAFCTFICALWFNFEFCDWLAVVDTIKLILLNNSNFSIAKIVVKEIERVKLTLTRLPTNT